MPEKYFNPKKLSWMLYSHIMWRDGKTAALAAPLRTDIAAKMAVWVGEPSQDIRIAVDALTQNLLEAIENGRPDLRERSLVKALKIASRLAALDPLGETDGVPNPYLRAVGQFGRFYYYVLRGDDRMAIMSIWSAAVEEPGMAALLVQPELYRIHYLPIEGNACSNLELFLETKEKQAEYERSDRMSTWHALTARFFEEGVQALDDLRAAAARSLDELAATPDRNLFESDAHRLYEQEKRGDFLGIFNDEGRA